MTQAIQQTKTAEAAARARQQEATTAEAAAGQRIADLERREQSRATDLDRTITTEAEQKRSALERAHTQRVQELDGELRTLLAKKDEVAQAVAALRARFE